VNYIQLFSLTAFLALAASAGTLLGRAFGNDQHRKLLVAAALLWMLCLVEAVIHASTHGSAFWQLTYFASAATLVSAWTFRHDHDWAVVGCLIGMLTINLGNYFFGMSNRHLVEGFIESLVLAGAVYWLCRMDSADETPGGFAAVRAIWEDACSRISSSVVPFWSRRSVATAP
jgi:hypothetical protein